jgi:hypothetical protein
MGLSPLQRRVCRLLARARIERGESYVAGGAALNELLGAPRLSRDIDLFHDTEAALDASWREDRALLERDGFRIVVRRDRPGFVEAEVVASAESVLIQWLRDSAFRFFPLVEHAEFGLTLHPFDLATSKVLALVGRVEARDFVDTLTCVSEVQPFGYLAWAACGKDPSFSPSAILAEARRTAQYSGAEFAELDYVGLAPDPKTLFARWRAQTTEAAELINALPPDRAGTAVLSRDGSLFSGALDELANALSRDDVIFHEGRIRGAFPQVR